MHISKSIQNNVLSCLKYIEPEKIKSENVLTAKVTHIE